MQKIPRPMGSTSQAYNYHQEQDIAKKKKLKRKYITFLIKNFINETLLYPYQTSQPTDKDEEGWIKTNNSPKTRNKRTRAKDKATYKTNTGESTIDVRCIRFFDLSQALRIDEVKLGMKVQAVLHKLGEGLASQASPMNYEYLTRAASLRLIKKSLEGLETQSDWASLVRHTAIDAGMKPGHILAANQAMSNEFAMTKGIFEMVNKAHQHTTKIGTQNKLILNQNGAPNHDQNGIPGEHINGQLITTSMAVKMIEAKGLNPVPSSQNGMLDEIGLVNGLLGPDQPQIRAIPSDAQGIMAFNPKDIIAMSHETRRQEELGIKDGISDVTLIDEAD